MHNTINTAIYWFTFNQIIHLYHRKNKEHPVLHFCLLFYLTKNTGLQDHQFFSVSVFVCVCVFLCLSVCLYVC